MAGRPLPQELTEALGAVLSERAGRRVSNKEIADKLGVHPSQVGRYLAGTKSPNLEEIRLMAEAVGADWFEVMQEAHERVAGGQVVPPISDPLYPPIGADPRALIRFLLENPERDEELNTRLSDAQTRSGLTGRRLVNLQETIRTVRREELEHALGALPPSAERAVDKQSG
jgi:transcriptional regulator with XRE-family HTH domain